MKISKTLKKTTQYPPLEGPLNTIGMFPIDPTGSYTGRPLDPEDEPIQDADDL